LTLKARSGSVWHENHRSPSLKLRANAPEGRKAISYQHQPADNFLGRDRQQEQQNDAESGMGQNTSLVAAASGRDEAEAEI
jgi:hypothetical protein